MTVRPHPLVRVVAALAVAFVLVPTIGFVSRLPWGSVGEILTSESLSVALRVSVATTLVATALSLLLGTGLGLVMATSSRRVMALLRAVLVIPVVAPPVVAGLVLLVAFGANAPLGRLLESLGWSLPFSPAGVIVAQTFVAFPFVAIAVDRSVAETGSQREEVAAAAGLSAASRFARVTLPSIRGALLAGGVLAWARAFGEFGATLTLAGSFPGRTQTLPQAVYLAVSDDRDAAIVGGCLMMFVAVSIAVAGMALVRGDGALRPAPRSRDRRTP